MLLIVSHNGLTVRCLELCGAAVAAVAAEAAGAAGVASRIVQNITVGKLPICPASVWVGCLSGLLLGDH